MPRFASIDVGTNSVLLLVADRQPDGRFTAVAEHAEITRLGRGVDKTKTLSKEGMEETLKVLEAFAAEARKLAAEGIAVTATSAARDASNGREFMQAAKDRAGLTIEIISGQEEAELSFAAVQADFGGPEPLVVLDIGGGSTEFIYGAGTQQTGHPQIKFRHSFDVGSVRMTERFVTAHPVPQPERDQIHAHLRKTFSTLPPPPKGFRLVGVAGTVTTLFSVQHGIDPYDATRVQGGRLSVSEVQALATRLCALDLPARKALPGLQPKRADVICAGALVLQCAMEALGTDTVTVSDRGLRWGLLAARFGGAATR